MKINPAGYERYQSLVQSLRSDSSAPKKGVQTAGKSENTDKVSFSEDAAARAELYRLKSQLSGEVDEVASEERLSALQQLVQSGAYQVPSEDVADAILGSI